MSQKTLSQLLGKVNEWPVSQGDKAFVGLHVRKATYSAKMDHKEEESLDKIADGAGAKAYDRHQHRMGNNPGTDALDYDAMKKDGGGPVVNPVYVKTMKEETVAEGLKLIKTYEQGGHSAKVYKDSEWGEHRVKYFKNGKHLPKADSHHDDKEDAHSTAQHQLKRMCEEAEAVNEVSYKLLQRYRQGVQMDRAVNSPDRPEDLQAKREKMDSLAYDKMHAGNKMMDPRSKIRVKVRASNRPGEKQGMYKPNLRVAEANEYDKDSVDKAIASSNRSGRKIGGKEGKAIHAILKGRTQASQTASLASKVMDQRKNRVGRLIDKSVDLDVKKAMSMYKDPDDAIRHAEQNPSKRTQALNRAYTGKGK